MILSVLVVCSFAVATAEFVMVGLLPEVSVDLAVSVPSAGFLVTAYMAVATVGAPAVMVLTKRWPRRAVLAAAMAVALASAVASVLAHSYGVLLVARLGSALGQALFVAVASQVAMAVVPVERQTAAVAKVFNGFALATVIGLPVGTLVGHAYGWRTTFVLVAVLCAIGLAGVLIACPEIAADGSAFGLAKALRVMLRPTILLGLATTVLAFTGFVAVFTYVAPMLSDVTGLSAGWVSAALVLYGLGTVAGSAVAGRVPPTAITKVLPLPLALLTGVLLFQAVALRQAVLAVVGLVLMGACTFAVAPLLQTWLMREAGPAAAGLTAAVNISVFGLAGVFGAGLGGAVLAAGVGLAALNAIAAAPVFGALAAAVLVGRARLRTTSSPVR